MVYIPNVWQDGDEITVKKLNHMEYGVSNQTLFIGTTYYEIDDETNEIITLKTIQVAETIILENSIDDIVNAVNNQNLTFILLKGQDWVSLERIYTTYIDKNNQRLIINTNEMSIDLNTKVITQGGGSIIE